MPKKITTKSSPAKKSTRKKITKRTVKSLLMRPLKRPLALRARRAHKSFLLTRRRDIPKRPKLPGYISFTNSVVATLLKFRKQFLLLLVVYVLCGLMLIGLAQQDEYRAITDALSEADAEVDSTVLSTANKVVGIFGATLFGSLSGSLTEIQQFYLVFVYVLMWLVIVWMLRQLLAGNLIRVRDALYNAAAPLVSTVCIVALMLIQSLPAALGVFIFSIATESGVLSGGAAAMMFGVAALLLIALSLYWLTSSFFALLIVTLPGTYPMVAIRGASDIALGRRLSLMLRLLWMVLMLGIIWAIILIPALLIDFWVKVSWLPLVTIAVQTATGLSLIFGVSYIFLLYRRMIDEPAE